MTDQVSSAPAVLRAGDEPAVGDRLVAGRRQVALLFTDLAGSTRLGRLMEPEDYAALMAAIRTIWRRAAARHRGLILRTQGDGALIVFGHPEPGEDDGRRAVEAALEIHEDVRRMRASGIPPAFLPLSMHSGIHAGVVLLAEGDVERGVLDVSGDVPNVAAHLAAAAEDGQILGSLAALGPHENLFDVGHVDEPVAGLPARQVRVVLGRSGLRHRYEATVRRGLTPMVGRESAVETLRAFAVDGEASSCLAIVGEPGVGKTRLLEEFLATQVTRGGLTLRGTCEQHLGAELLQPFAQLIRSYFGLSARVRMGEVGDEIKGALDVFPGEVAGALLRFLTYDAPPSAGAGTSLGHVLEFFGRISATEPVTLLVDDWQWADDASLQLLTALVALPRGPRIVLAMRPSPDGVVPPQASRLLRLSPLGEAESAVAVRRWLPYADPFVCHQIHRYSGGIPLFIEELCHSASVGELARDIERAAGSRNWVSALAVSRLGRLHPDLAGIVRAAAVVGSDAPVPLLAAALGRVPAPAQLRALSQADFLFVTDTARTVSFKHGITQAAVYESIGLEDRRRLHERALGAILGASGGAPRIEDAEALAHHSRGAGKWDEAARHSERAGDKAMAAFAIDRARVHYSHALDALRRGGDGSREAGLRWCKVAAKYGMSCVFDPLPLGGDTSVFEEAVRKASLLGEPNAVARAEYWLAYILYALGRFREARQHIVAAEELAAATPDGKLLAQVSATRGEIMAATSEPGAVAVIDRAVAEKRELADPHPGGALAIGSAYALACKGGLLADRGDFGGAHQAFDEARRLLGASTHPVGNSVRNWIAVAYNWQGRWPQAHEVAVESERIAASTRALLLLAVARSTLAYAQWRAHGTRDGLQQLDEAMRWMHERGNGFFTSIFHGWLAAAYAQAGDHDAARLHATRVFQRARQGEGFGDACACRALAWVAAERGDHAKSGIWMLRAAQAAERRGSPREQALNEWALAQLAQRRGDAATAERRLDAALGMFGRLGMDSYAQAAAREGRSLAVPILA